MHRLQLIVEAAQVSRTRLGGPLAVVANEKVAHGLSECRRFDLDAGLGLDADVHFHEVRQPRLARPDAHEQLHRPFFGAALDRVSRP